MLIQLKKLIPSNIKRIIKNLPRTIRKITHPNPKQYSDIISDYQKYIKIQTEKYKSYESENQHWSEGKERYIKKEYQSGQEDFRYSLW